MTDPKVDELPRVLGGREAITLVVGSIIGSGIFLVPRTVADEVGDPGLVLAVWVAVGILTLLGALCYAEVAAMTPRAGGMYVYLTETYGRTWGFLRGWTELVLLRTGSAAIQAVAFTMSLHQILPLPGWAQRVVPVAIIALLAVVNVRGARQGGSVQNWTTLARIVALVAMAVLPFATGHASGANWVPRAPEPGGAEPFSGLGAAVLACIWAYTGWVHIGPMAGELKDPQRTVPMGLIFGVLIVIALFLSVNVAFLSVLPVAELAKAEHPAAAFMQIVAGNWGRSAISLIVMCSTFGGVNAGLLTASRTYFAMAQDGVLFAPLARIHPAYRTPSNAILLHAAWAIALLLGCSLFQQLFFQSTELRTLFSTLVSVVVFGGAIFEGSAIAAVIVLRRRCPERPRPYRTPGYPWVPGLVVVAYLGLLASTVLQKPVHSAIGLVLIACGLPMLGWQTRRPVPAPSEVPEAA